MAVVMIGIDPRKASHTAVAISAAEEPLGELRVRACAAQAERLLAWAAAWPQRTWAVEGAGGLGHLLARQLLGAGERVLDVQPKLGARVRLLTAGDSNKNDPNDARSVAIASLPLHQIQAPALNIYLHKYVQNVNMTYIDCSYKFSPYQHIADDPLPKYPDSFYLKTQFDNVTINFTGLFANIVYNNN